MRKFNSYGPINTKLHYYAPRTQLIDHACQQLLGQDPAQGGHYTTVWAPRQTGKTWIMQEVVEQIKLGGDFEVAMVTPEFPTGNGKIDLIINHANQRYAWR